MLWWSLVALLALTLSASAVDAPPVYRMDHVSDATCRFDLAADEFNGVCVAAVHDNACSFGREE